MHYLHHLPVVLHFFVLFACFMVPARAQNLSTWSGGTGEWLNAGAWTPSGVPSDALSDVVIDNAPGTTSSVTFGRNDNVGTDLTIGRLRIDSGDTLQFGAAPTTLQFGSGGFSGAGSLILNGTMSLPWSSNTLRGAKSITGSGQLLLGSQGQRPNIYDAVTNAATIKGSAAFGQANASNPQIINSGLIESNLSGQDIDFHGQGGANRSVNTGTLKATNGAVMSFGQGEWLNNPPSATISISAEGPNSRVAFYRGGLIEDGTISATGGGVLEVGGLFAGGNGGATFKNVTLTGPTNLVQTLLINGTLTNNGVMTIPSGALLGNATNSVTISGTGQIVLDAPDDNSPELIDQGNSSLSSVPWLFSGVKVRGRGNVGYKQSGGSIDNVAITNQGTFEADVDGQTLLIDVANFDNRSGGLLRATGSGNNALGGVLRLTINGPLKNTDGTIEAVNKGRVEAGAVRVEGGLVKNNGGFIDLNGWTLVNPTGPGTDPAVPLKSDGLILSGQLTLGITGINQSAKLVGEIMNTGTLRIAASTGTSSFLRISEYGRPNVSLTGNGEVILGTFDNATIGEGTSGILETVDVALTTRTFNNVNNTIRGFGVIGNSSIAYGQLAMKNTGTIMADISGRELRLELASMDNQSGTLRASNGGKFLYGGGGINNAGGFIEALNTSLFQFFGAPTVTGGTIRNIGAASTARNFDLAGATLVNLTLQGPLIIRETGGAGMVGTIQNEGHVQLLSSSDSTRTRLGIGSGGTNSVTLNGPGELILGDPALGGSAASVEAGNGSINPTLTLNQKMRGFGVLGFNSSTDRGMHLINNSEVNADVNGKQLALVPHTILNSPGKSLKATNGGTLYFHPIQLTNTDATISAATASAIAFDIQTTVTGGNVSSAPGGSINVLRDLAANGGVVFSNMGTMEFGVQGGSAFNGLANGGSSIINSGTVRKVGGSDYSVFSPLNNTGAINVQSGILRWKAGGQLTNSNFSAEANTDLTFQDTPFTFSGVNTFTGPGNHWFYENGAVTLADEFTSLNVNGNFNLGNTTVTGLGTFNAGGTLTIHSGTSIFSGAKLFTASGIPTTLNSGSSLQFQNSAKWENRGPVTINTSNPIEGTNDTLFTNTTTGVLTANSGNQGNLDMPYVNSGTFAAGARRLHVRRAGVFRDGKTISSGEGTYFEAPFSVEGPANTATGPGFMNVYGVVTFATEAKLSAERIAFNGTSGTTGGELEVSASASFYPPSNQTSVLDGTQIRLLAGSTNNAAVSRGTLRLQNGAALRNAGTFNIDRSMTIELNSNSVLENAGTLTTTSPGNGASYFGGDDTALFRTLAGSTTQFNFTGDPQQHFVSIPFDLAGDFFAQPGAYTVFNKGGLLNETAKIWPNGPGATITFTGADKIYRSRGRAVEFPGTGSVNFVGTTLQFEPSTLSTFPGGQLDESSINAGARVAFQGNNTIKSSQALIDMGRQGTLSTTGFVFASGSQVVDHATLETFGTADTSVWNAAGQKLELKNGAKFVNGGRFVIQSQVGSLANDPGIFGDATTLFHNTSTGRLVHDSNTLTEIGVDFLNEGFLEFRTGTFKFLKKFSGHGGIAASNGAQVQLSLVGVSESLFPQAFELNGTGSKISIALGAGQAFSAGITLNGGQIVAAGGLNMVAAGGLNMVAAGGGNIVAAGGLNMVAAGGGNITSTGVNSLIDVSGKMVAAGGGNILSHNGSQIVAAGGLNANGGFIGTNGGKITTPAEMVADGGGNILSHNGGQIVAAGGLNMVAAGGGNILSHNGGQIVAAGGLNMVAAGGGNMVAAGGGNIVAAGGGNMVAAGGGNIVAAGGLNLVPTVAARSFRTALNTAASVSPTLDELSGAVGADALVAKVNALNTDSNVGVLFVDAGGTAEATGGGSIIAESQGIIAGGGTFTGPGLIKTGGGLFPGSTVGSLTWNGALNVQTGGRLEIEIGGTTSYDSIVNTGSVIVDGTITIKFLNNFQASVQPTDSFDIITSNTAVGGAFVNAGRVAVEGTNGSFAVTTVNDGKTLRLTDFAVTPVTFSSWASRLGLTGDDALMTADPDFDGISNLLEYALGLDPNAPNARATTLGSVTDNGIKYLSLSYTRPTGPDLPSDILYTPRRSVSLSTAWSGDNLVTHSTDPGPGALETVTIRSTIPMDMLSKEYLQLQVTLESAPAN